MIFEDVQNILKSKPILRTSAGFEPRVDSEALKTFHSDNQQKTQAV